MTKISNLQPYITVSTIFDLEHCAKYANHDSWLHFKGVLAFILPTQMVGVLYKVIFQKWVLSFITATQEVWMYSIVQSAQSEVGL